MATMYCNNCGTVGSPRTRTKGSFLIEVFLWLMLIVPGIIYSLWRLTTKEKVCPGCGAPNMLPLDSPKARAALAQLPAGAARPQATLGRHYGCPACGKTVREGEASCRHCGQALTPATAVPGSRAAE